MREDKVTQRKNKSQKNIKVSININENENVIPEEDLETKGEQVDICDIAEQCFMEEIRQDTDVTDFVHVEMDIDQDQWHRIFLTKKIYHKF